MASVIFSINIAGSVVSRQYTVTGPNLIRFLANWRGILGQIPDGQGGFRDRTDTETVHAIIGRIVSDIKAASLDRERHAGVADIPFEEA